MQIKVNGIETEYKPSGYKVVKKGSKKARTDIDFHELLVRGIENVKKSNLNVAGREHPANN